jgi:hypothetical protein
MAQVCALHPFAASRTDPKRGIDQRLRWSASVWSAPRNRTADPILTMDLAVTAMLTGVSASMGSGLVKGVQDRPADGLGRLLVVVVAGSSGRGRPGQVRSWLACTHSGPGWGVRMTVKVRTRAAQSGRAAVLPADAETRARPVGPAPVLVLALAG